MRSVTRWGLATGKEAGGGGSGSWGVFPFASYVQTSRLTSVFFTDPMGIIYAKRTSSSYYENQMENL